MGANEKYFLTHACELDDSLDGDGASFLTHACGLDDSLDGDGASRARERWDVGHLMCRHAMHVPARDE